MNIKILLAKVQTVSRVQEIQTIILKGTGSIYIHIQYFEEEDTN
jgi:hypothetical protein